jgi:hypothetical protein
MWLKWIYGNVGIIGDRAGQLGKMENLDVKEDEWSNLIFGAPRW